MKVEGKAARRQMARATEQQHHGGELGRPGVPEKEVQPFWQSMNLQAKSWTLVGQITRPNLQVDLWVKPAKFPLEAMVAYRTGNYDLDLRMQSARRAAEEHQDLLYAATLMAGIKQRLLDPRELYGDTLEYERQMMLAAIPSKSYGIPANKQMEWDPEIHGHEADDDAEDFDYNRVACMQWRPGLYDFNFGSGLTGSIYIHAPWEVSPPFPGAGHVPPQYPDQRILKGMHALLGQFLEE